MIRTLVIAPHVDDELIGCYTILTKQYAHVPRQTSVWYLFELNRVRREEAEGAAKRLGFEPYFQGTVPWSIDEFDEIYVPMRQDRHPHHREANTLYRGAATHFYSVDMEEGAKRLNDLQTAEKRHLLDKLYPSQSQLWERDARYYLFEHIVTEDFDTYVTLPFLGGYKVRCLEKYQDDVNQVILRASTLLGDRSFIGDTKALFNAFVSACPSGHVTLATPYPNKKEYTI